ncbi:transglycosylase SLT domain-containing protein [archaeon]|jgi:hypothetical protein|nr:transglycosylase SLT domain-containing protein [archaeon]
MRGKKLFLIGGIFIFSLLLLAFVSSYTLSNARITETALPGSFLSDFAGSGFNQSMCMEGQDFIIQMAPLGCTPTVVRSDLLEENDVPVFCEVKAIKINPLIEVSAVNSISFGDQTSQDIRSVGFHVNRVALQDKNRINSFIDNSLGYATIILRQQPNESAMPEFVEGNLTARIKYDLKNAFGIRKNYFYLPELTDEQFQANKNQYSFWERKGYVRAEGVSDDSATIVVYSDTLQSPLVGDNQRRLGAFNLREGETSSKVFLPGFDCLASFQIKLDEVDAPDTRARLRINSEYVEVKKGESFLENKCKVLDLEAEGLNQKVRIKCEEDASRTFSTGKKIFDLRISPSIVLNVDGDEANYKIGDRIYWGAESKEKSLYLGYVAEEEGVLMAGIVSLDSNAENLSAEMIKSVGNDFDDWVDGLKVKNIEDFGKKIFTGIQDIPREIINKKELDLVKDTASKKVEGVDIKVVGFGEGSNSPLEKEIQEFYEKSFEDYDDVLFSYVNQKYPLDEEVTLGEKALSDKITLAYSLEQKRDVLVLCEEFEEKYSQSNVDLTIFCEDELYSANNEISTKEVLVDGDFKLISFEKIYEPSLEEYSAVVQVRYPNGTIKDFILTKNDAAYINGTEFLRLDELKIDSARIQFSLDKRSFSRDVENFVSSGNDVLKKNIPQDFRSMYVFTLKEVNIKNQAKISLIPNVNRAGTEADFSFRVGIEKRAIKLSPEKTEEKIENLNKSIVTWTKISDNLGKVVQGLKTACLGTGAVLTIKNLVAKDSGIKSISRTEVMRGDGGWYEKCADMIKDGLYKTEDACLLDNAEVIDGKVKEISSELNLQNERFKQLEAGITDSNVLSDNLVNTTALMDKYIPEANSDLSSLGAKLESPYKEGEFIDIETMKSVLTKDGWEKGYYDLDELKEIELYSSLYKKTGDESYQKKLYSVLSDVKQNSDSYVERIGFLEKYGFDEGYIGSQKKAKKIRISNVKTFGEVDDKFSGVAVDKDRLVYPYKDQLNNKEYLLVLDNDYTVNETYSIDGGNLNLIGNASTNVNPLGLKFEKFDTLSYENDYKNAEVKYYETEPYKGLPAIVPVDVNKGWYAYVKQKVAVLGGENSYDLSGRVNSFYLCNVGRNGLEEFESGLGDDICELINLGTGQPYNQFEGLESGEATSLIKRAVRAIEEASRKYKSEVRSVNILGRNIKVGSPATNIPDVRCSDVMSPKDCQVLFNVCDPVICPSSRCDFGGAYPVKDVIQSGIIGSAALCLPNFPDVKVPVCLTGIQAGVDGLLSVSNAYQDCLQQNLDTGETVGICDEIHSVYLCEFFWRQALPLGKVAIPKILGALTGQNTRGGGEYLGIASAWSNAESSLKYFTNYYALNSINAFKARSTEEVGGEVCKAFASVSYPTGAGFLDALTTPDSPTQFNGNFEEIPFTTVTNPPISHYKVFYHIYAGKDRGAYYRVYLRGGTGSSFYLDATFSRSIGSGYIPVGESKTETIDITAPAGYNTLCINVNGQEECGFGQVSTSFARDWLKDQYIKDEQTKTDIKGEKECISGSPNVYSLLNSNIQEGVGNLIDPEIYNKGVIRICATGNPGQGTDPYVGREGQRWIDVGDCDDGLKCWMDTNSIPDAVEFATTVNQSLKELEEHLQKTTIEESDYLNDAEFGVRVEEILDETNLERKLSLIEQIFDKVYFNHEVGYLHYLRGGVYGNIVKEMYVKFLEEKRQREIQEMKEALIKEGISVAGKTDEEIQKLFDEIAKEKREEIEDDSVILSYFDEDFVSPKFEYKDRNVNKNLCYKYFKGEWHWTLYCDLVGGGRTIIDSTTGSLKSGGIGTVPGFQRIDWVSVNELEDPYGKDVSNSNEKFIFSLRGVSFERGISLFTQRIIEGRNIFSSTFITDRIKMNSKEEFIISQEDKFKINIKFEDDSWIFDYKDNFLFLTPKYFNKDDLKEDIQILIEMLEPLNFYDGSIVIFSHIWTEEGEEPLIIEPTFGEFAASIAETYARDEYDHVRIDADGSENKSYPCASFASKVWYEAGARADGFSAGEGECASIDYLVNLFDESNRFIAVGKDELEAGDFVVFGSSEDSTIHSGIFNNYSEEGKIGIYSDHGFSDPVDLTYYNQDESWFVTFSYRYVEVSESLSDLLSFFDYDDEIRKYSSQHDLRFNFLKSVMKQESNFNPYAVSSTGCVGLMQFCDSTAGDFQSIFGKIEDCSCENVCSVSCTREDIIERCACDIEDGRFDAEKSIEAGAKYLSFLESRYRNYGQGYSIYPTLFDYELFALAAYNGGMGLVDKVIEKTELAGEEVTWGNAQKYFTEETFRQFEVYSDWSDSQIEKKRVEIVGYVSKVASYVSGVDVEDVSPELGDSTIETSQTIIDELTIALIGVDGLIDKYGEEVVNGQNEEVTAFLRDLYKKEVLTAEEVLRKNLGELREIISSKIGDNI